jgi:hypothetical protein
MKLNLIKEEEIEETGSMHRRYDKYIQNSG